ncbi:MAG: alanine racemase [Actinomycetes bacterium]
MSLTLHVAAEKWRTHLTALVANSEAQVVPVIKGNGYGFGKKVLAQEAKNMNLAVVAVATIAEAQEVQSVFPGEILLLSPSAHSDSEKVIHTISPHSSIFSAKMPKKFVLELLSPIHRHGFSVSELGNALDKYSKSGKCEGIAIHLPIDQKSSASEWIDKNLRLIVEREIDTTEFNNSVWVSHLSENDLINLKKNWPQIIWKVRIGTDLWLGDRGALKVKAQLLDLHAIQSPTRVGYRQYRIGRGWLLVVSGGTSNGIGLEVATPKRDFISQAKTLTKSFLNTFGWNPSPFSWNGKKLEFAEAPHMHVSLLTLKGKAAPEIGSVIDVEVRFTATTFDQVVFD